MRQMDETVASHTPADTRERRGSWAPGSYMCNCSSCGGCFVGDKRALICAPCAYDDMPVFRSLEWHSWENGDMAVIVLSDRTYSRDSPEITGKTVLVDGMEYVVVKTERFMIAPPIYPGERICLVLRRVDS